MNKFDIKYTGKNMPVWSGKVLLIVEDEDHNYTYIHEILKRTRVKIIRAETGEEAISLFKKNNVDIVLMDIKLPDVDGLTTTRTLKKLRPDVPVIAQTAYAMIQERDRCLRAGCDDYISKPFDPEKLIQIVGHHIEQLTDHGK